MPIPLGVKCRIVNAGYHKALTRSERRNDEIMLVPSADQRGSDQLWEIRKEGDGFFIQATQDSVFLGWGHELTTLTYPCRWEIKEVKPDHYMIGMVSDKTRGRIDALTLLEGNDPEPDLCLYGWREEDKDLDLRVWYLAPLSIPSFPPTIPSLGFESDIGKSYTITNGSQSLNVSNEDRGYLIVGFKASDDTDSESNVWQIRPQGKGFTFYNAKNKRYLGALGVKADFNPFVWKVHKLHYGQGFRSVVVQQNACAILYLCKST